MDGSKLEVRDSRFRRDTVRNVIRWDHGRLEKRGRLETAASRGPIVNMARGKQPRLHPSPRQLRVVAAIELVGREKPQNAQRQRFDRKVEKFGKASAAFRHYPRYR